MKSFLSNRILDRLGPKNHRPQRHLRQMHLFPNNMMNENGNGRVFWTFHVWFLSCSKSLHVWSSFSLFHHCSRTKNYGWWGSNLGPRVTSVLDGGVAHNHFIANGERYVQQQYRTSSPPLWGLAGPVTSRTVFDEVAVDILDLTQYSIKQAKLRKEENHRMKLADEKKLWVGTQFLESYKIIIYLII